MTDYPIIFRAPMILALLAGRKTMTRRRAWRDDEPHPAMPEHFHTKSSLWKRVKPGDRLWVRENAQLRSVGPAKGEVAICYKADGPIGGAIHQHIMRSDEKSPYSAMKLTPSIHMPRWASRLTLLVTATKIERLQEISDEDALAEGIIRRKLERYNVNAYFVNETVRDESGNNTAHAAFRQMWEQLRGDESWDDNPEVVALTFEVHKTNIDAMPKAEAA